MTQNAADTAGRHVLALNGGQVEERDGALRLSLAPVSSGYADAQIDDYGGADARLRHRPGVALDVRTRFSHAAEGLRGTAGLGFWNAPYGDPTQRRLALPQAAWFFFASPPNALPFAPDGPGHGWFAATLDAGAPRALALLPLAPVALALHQAAPLRRRLWPAIRRRLGVAAAPLPGDMRQWHDYRLEWRPSGCRFFMDGRLVLDAPHAPRGPLGFVCWIDNQYLIATPRGRLGHGTLLITSEQWVEVTLPVFSPLTDWQG